MRRYIFLTLLACGLVAAFLFISTSNIIELPILRSIASFADQAPVNFDIEPQRPLVIPPEPIKAIYLTSYSGGNATKIASVIKLIKETELNAVVVDMKDYSGFVAYNTDLELPKEYKAVDPRIPALNKLVKKFHDENIYIIARVSVFQDQQLAKARPDLALISSSTQQSWKDYKGLMWMDTSSQEVWDYNIAIAEELAARGVDEINFDYIRFASDGNLADIKYPFWDGKTYKTAVLKSFFQYLREKLADAVLSADLFGLVTVNTDGLGIGQHLEYALPYFDAIAPMTYPSHYYKGFIGIEKPAEEPYKVIKYSMDSALLRVKAHENALRAAIGNSTTTPMPRIAKLRPWFQDFDLGADYDEKKVRAQIQAWYDSSANQGYTSGGWMLWNASNNYTRAALEPASFVNN
ncbi:MAG: Uncharacterized protein G01um10143_435 [Parcubacteria group bacterium Gr01-1014_3]|nr:MAG: Uncharacterized protein G01um10143_435 [Parcubacteria group bacterium Gr01-1014_3]